MGVKIPQQSNPSGYSSAENTIWSLKTRAPNQEVRTPIFIRAHIQLTGNDLANNHTFILLSRLLKQTFSKKNIAPEISIVNPQTHNGKIWLRQTGAAICSEESSTNPVNQAVNYACRNPIHNHRSCNRKHLRTNAQNEHLCVCPVRTHIFVFH